MDDVRRYFCVFILLGSAVMATEQASAVSVQESNISPQASDILVITDWLTHNVPSAVLQQLEQRSNDELALLQASRYRLQADQLSAVSERFKRTLNQERVLNNWQQALQRQVSVGKIAGLAKLAQAPLINNPLYVEMEKRLRETDWTSDEFQNYQTILQKKSPNPQRYALVQAIVVARGGLVFEINLSVSVRKQLLMTVAKLTKNWVADEAQMTEMLSIYQRNQLDTRMPEQVNRLMYAYRFTTTQQLQDYLLLLESDRYQAAVSAWRNALEVALFNETDVDDKK